jgi:hypothetical protein
MQQKFLVEPMVFDVSLLENGAAQVRVATFDSAPLILIHGGTEGREADYIRLKREFYAAMELLLQAVSDPNALMTSTSRETEHFKESERIQARATILIVIEFAKRHTEEIAEAVPGFMRWVKINKHSLGSRVVI